MKLTLSVKITLRDYFPKNKSIPYENFICLIKHNNNFISQIRFPIYSENNFINHKVESINSNIIYNFHIFDSYKKSLIGISHLCINFDKVKNLNINDTLTQEGNHKLIIDSQTKRKFFDTVTNMGDIYLIISTEIKILNKTLYEPNKSKNRFLVINNENINISNINNTCANLNITPKSLKKKQIIKSLKNNNYESLNIFDTFYGRSELNNYTTYLEENDLNTFYQSTVTKKNKSTNKAKVNLKNIIKNNNNQYNFHNSCAELMSPKYNSKTNIHKKNNKSKKKTKISLNKKRVSILSLIEQKIDKSKFRQNYDSICEISTPSNTLYNFNKIQKGNNLSKKDYNTFNCFNKFNCVKKEKNEQDFFKKKNKNKIQINLCGKNEISTERKLNSKKKLELIDYSRINTDIMKPSIIFKNKHPNITINNNLNTNIFLQTEGETSTYDKLPQNKISLNKNILRNLNLKKISTNKNISNNNKLKDETRGTFSPKLSLKLKFDENILLTDENNTTQTRNNQNIYKKLMTPKGNRINFTEMNFTYEKNDEKINEKLRKKYLGIFDCYNLLIKKIKYNYYSNKLFRKKFDEIRERCNHLNKLKNRINDRIEENDSKRIINHTFSHFEEEKLLTKMINIKLKENSVYDLIFSGAKKNTNTLNKINILISQKENILLNLIKNTVKYYGNISQIYNEESMKKQELIKLLDKYDIKEKNKKINLNYINYMNQTNNFRDKVVITEVDEEKENEEENDEYINKNNNLILDNEFNSDNKNNISENKIKEIKISIPNLKNSNVNKIENDNDDNNYDENLNSLIEKILIEQFPENYDTKERFVHIDKNKYFFKNKIFFAYIEDNDIILKEDEYGYKYTLNEFYNQFCLEDKKENKSNFIYTKKIRQKYIKIKSYDEKEINNDKKMSKNENNTTMDTDFIQQSTISKGYEISE